MTNTSIAMRCFERLDPLEQILGLFDLLPSVSFFVKDRRGSIIGIAGFSRQVDQLRSPGGTVAAFADVIAHLHRCYDTHLTTPKLAKMADLSTSQ